MNKNSLTEGIHCWIDGASGQYIPRRFAKETKRECITGVSQEDLDYLTRGPGGCLDEDTTLAEDETERGEFYWDTWQTVIDNAIVTCPVSGLKFKLFIGESGGDLFLVSEDWEWNDETNSFEHPESDTLRRFKLPSYWASALINGDESGMDEKESADIEAFLNREEMKGWTCADVSEHTWFSHSNDAGTLAGDVARYTFIKI